MKSVLFSSFIYVLRKSFFFSWKKTFVVSVILSPVLSVRVILSRIAKFLSLENNFRAIYFQYSYTTLLHLCISIFSSLSWPCFAFLRLFFKGIIKNMLFLQKGIFLMVLTKSIQRNSLWFLTLFPIFHRVTKSLVFFLQICPSVFSTKYLW